MVEREREDTVVFVEDGVYGESGLSSTTFKLIRR
jgi:hypothetical protein